MQYTRHWAVCMYVYIYMSTKNFGLSIMGFKLIVLLLLHCVVWFIAIFSGVFQVSYSRQVDLEGN